MFYSDVRVGGGSRVGVRGGGVPHDDNMNMTPQSSPGFAALSLKTRLAAF